MIETFMSKVILSILIGALLGMEREYHKKQEIMGLRTYSLVSLLGAVSAIIPVDLLGRNTADFAALGLIFTSIFALVIYVNSLVRRKGPGFTTCISIIITYVLGVMCGYGLFLEAIFLSVTVAVILFSREKLHSLVKHLTRKEVGDLLEFLIILGIIYPIVPQNFTVYGITLPLTLIWSLIVLVSLINFVAFLSARFLKGSYQVEIVSFLGGMMSSIAATIAISNFYRENPKRTATILAGFFTINAGLSLRNLIIVGVPAPSVLQYALLPFTIIIFSFMLFSYSTLKRVMQGKKTIRPIKVESPFNVRIGLELGFAILLLFVLLELAGHLGVGAFLLTSFIGGVVSSTATCISLAGLVSGGMVDPVTGAFALFLANAGSIAFAWVLCYLMGAMDIIKYSARQMFMVMIISMLALFIPLGVAFF